MTNCEGRIFFFFFKKFSQQEEKFRRQKAALLEVTPYDLVRILCPKKPKFSIKNIVKPLHNGLHGERRNWPLWRSRGGRSGQVGV